MSRAFVCLLLLTALYNNTAYAGINDGLVVWLAPNAGLSGVRQVEFHPVLDETGKHHDIDAAGKAAQTLQQKLTQSGMTLVGPGDSSPQRLVIKTSLVFYQPGSVGGRWIGFGGGAAVCILRSRLIDGNSGRLLGDLIGAYQVQAGGLFSAGAEKRVPTAAAELLAERILELVGLGEIDYEVE